MTSSLSHPVSFGSRSHNHNVTGHTHTPFPLALSFQTRFVYRSQCVCSDLLRLNSVMNAAEGIDIAGTITIGIRSETGFGSACDTNHLTCASSCSGSDDRDVARAIDFAGTDRIEEASFGSSDIDHAVCRSICSCSCSVDDENDNSPADASTSTANTSAARRQGSDGDHRYRPCSVAGEKDALPSRTSAISNETRDVIDSACLETARREPPSTRASDETGDAISNCTRDRDRIHRKTAFDDCTSTSISTNDSDLAKAETCTSAKDSDSGEVKTGSGSIRTSAEDCCSGQAESRRKRNPIYAMQPNGNQVAVYIVLDGSTKDKRKTQSNSRIGFRRKKNQYSGEPQNKTQYQPSECDLAKS